MRRLYWLIMFFVGFALSGCAYIHGLDNPPPANPPSSKQTPAKKTTSASAEAINKKKLSKDPWTVAVYPHGIALKHPYTILAHESISKFNAGGIKRQEANIHDTLRNLAASMGGDAVINVTHGQRYVTATIVSFAKSNVG